MLPPGHIAAGYLTAKVVLQHIPYHLSIHQQQTLAAWGVFWAFAPDLDTFYSFAKSKAFAVKPEINHRKFYSHAPVLWLIAGLLVFAFARTPYMKVFGLLIWLGSWSHFLLDTIQYGVQWLWPLSSRLFQIIPVRDQKAVDQKMSAAFGMGFIKYWLIFMKEYVLALPVSVTLEAILLITTFLLILSHKI